MFLGAFGYLGWFDGGTKHGTGRFVEGAVEPAFQS
jgi:hypothetical protein